MPKNDHPTYTTDEEVIAALYKTSGNVSKAAKLLGLKVVGELRVRINNKPHLRQAKQEALEQLLDLAEQKVVTKMTKADAKWILERKGRGRGWGTVVHNANLNLNVGTYDFSQYPLEERMKLLEMINGAGRSRDDEHASDDLSGTE
jgi:hypothetical protein